MIPAATQRALATLEWVRRGENLCVCGPSGTGKSHFLEALGQDRSADERCLVLTRVIGGAGAPALCRRLGGRGIGRILKAHLVVVVDNIGLLPCSSELNAPNTGPSSVPREDPRYPSLMNKRRPGDDG